MILISISFSYCVLIADKVEVIDHRVAVCRDHAKDACKRQQCKYYHIPIAVPPAHVMANIFKKDSTPLSIAATALASPLNSFTTTILQTSADAISARTMDHINQTTNTITTTTTVTEASLNERHCPPIRSHRSATQTHL